MDQKAIEEETKKQILEEMNMSEDYLNQSVENLISWLRHQPHLPHTIDPNVVKSFIIGCRSVELGKQRLEKYFMSRITYPEELTNLNPLNIKWDCIQPMAILPDMTQDGYMISFLTMPDFNKTPKFNFLETVRYQIMTFELLIRARPYIKGLIGITDLKNLSLKMVPKVNLTNVSNTLTLIDSVYPCQLKRLYNFNTPQVADTLQRTFIRPFMREGIYNSILSYTQDEKSLKKHIPLEILPQEYGGKAPSLSEIMDDWRVKLENAKDIFTGECSLLPNESKIPKKLTNSEQFGTSGTFRKLDID